MKGRGTEKLNKRDIKNKPVGKNGRDSGKKCPQLYFNATWHRGAEGIWPKKNVKATGQKEGRDTERSDRLRRKKEKNTTEMCENHRTGTV